MAVVEPYRRPALPLPTDRAPSRRAACGNEQAVVEIPTSSCQAKRCDRGLVAACFPHGPRAVPACSAWKRARRGGNPNPLVPSQVLRPGTGRGLLSPRTARRPGVQRVETSKTRWKSQPPCAKPSAATGDQSRPTFHESPRAKLVGKKFTLTRGRTSAWHLSPEERQPWFPRPGNRIAPAWRRFRGSMFE